MPDIDARIAAAMAAREEGRYADALVLQQALFTQAERQEATGESPYFMAMFGLQMLLPVHPPTHAAVQIMRDDQVRRLLQGERHFGAPVWEGGKRPQRFAVIVELNDLIGDAESTCVLFVRFDESDPVQARQYAGRALPALVACGAWALAERYRGDPLAWLADCNALAYTFPLFPPPRAAPRLAATLMNLVREVYMGAAVLDGLGNAPAALALRAALIDGIEGEVMRDLAQRELAAPGTISRELVAHQMAQEHPSAGTGK
jgi:hypothetical protein